MCPMLRVLFTTAIALLVCAEAHATLVKWTLNDVSFDDGGAASGFFIVDTTTAQLAITPPSDFGSAGGGFDITTTFGSILDSGEYVPLFIGSGTQEFGVDSHSFRDSFGNVDFTAEMRLNIDTDLLHTTHGTFQVLPGPTGQCGPFDSRCSEESLSAIFLPTCDVSSGSGCTVFRTVVAGGTVTATIVPEPSIFAFLGLAAGLLVIMRKRL
jgi:hypothetical protein